MMATKPGIEDGVQMPLPAKRGPKANRAIAKKAADAIRMREHASIPDAARAHFHECEELRPTIAVIPENQEDARNDRFKDFVGYIAEDLRNGPKSWHVFCVLNKRTKQQRNQPKEKQNRIRRILNEMREALNLPKF